MKHGKSNQGPFGTDQGYSVESRLIHGQMESPHWDYADHIVPPMSASTSYRLESVQRGASGFSEFANPDLGRAHKPILIYDRLEEPSRSMLEENLRVAENGETAVCFATGMAAISAALGVVLKAGDTLVSHRTIYGCTHSLLSNWLPRLDVKVVFADLCDTDALQQILAENSSVMAVYGETPCNPNLEILDLAELSAVVERCNQRRSGGRRVLTVIDNTFSTPYCQRPLEFGIDIVVHSLTKNIAGFGTDMGGVVIGPKLIEPDLLLYRKDFGAVLSPRAAWSILVHGLPTLVARSRQQIDSANQVANFLESHEMVDRVLYPGLDSHPQHELAKRQMRSFDGSFAPGSMIYFHLKGEGELGKQRGARMMDVVAKDSLTVTLAVSLGQIRTLIEHPASMTHATIPADRQRLAGIDPGGVRLSLGLESVQDVLRDLGEALERCDVPRRQVAG